MYILFIKENPNSKDWDRLVGAFATKDSAEDFVAALDQGSRILEYKIRHL